MSVAGKWWSNVNVNWYGIFSAQVMDNKAYEKLCDLREYHNQSSGETGTIYEIPLELRAG